MIVEGTRVVYAGDTDPFQSVGAPGRVVAMSGDHAHVQWLGGPKSGGLDLVDLNELVVDRQHTARAAAEPVLGTMTTSAALVRSSYDEQGETGVLAVLNETGHLAGLTGEAEDAVLTLCGRIASDASVSEALSALEVDERDVVVAKIAHALLTDRLRES